MSTTGTEINLSPGFSRAVGGAPDTAELRYFTSHLPYRRLIRFQGDWPVKKKRELFPGLSAGVSEFVCVATRVIQAPVQEY